MLQKTNLGTKYSLFRTSRTWRCSPRLRLGSVFAQACSPLLRLRTIFGTLRRIMLNCFNSSQVGPELVPYIKMAKIGPHFENEPRLSVEPHFRQHSVIRRVHRRRGEKFNHSSHCGGHGLAEVALLSPWTEDQATRDHWPRNAGIFWRHWVADVQRGFVSVFYELNSQRGHTNSLLAAVMSRLVRSSSSPHFSQTPSSRMESATRSEQAPGPRRSC